MDLIVIFVSKLLDCAFGALKTTFFIRNKFVISAMCASFSTVFFILSIKQSGLFAYFAIFIATFLGNYFPPVVIKKLEKDILTLPKLYENWIYLLPQQKLEISMVIEI